MATAPTQHFEASGSPVSGTVVMRGPAHHDVHVRLIELGDGPPMVFLPGLVGINEHWLEAVERVKSRARCLMIEVPLLELRGEDCSIEGVTEMMGGYLAEQIGEPVVLVGSSFGGHVGLRLAIQRPELIGGLVLVGSSGLGEKPIGGPRVKRTRDWVEETLAELFFDRSKMPAGEADRAWGELSDKVKAKRMFRLSRSVFKNHLGDELGLVQAPTLVLWGREDQITLPETAEEFASAIPGAELEWIEQCGHAPMIEKPAEFGDALLRFGERIGICGS